MIVMIVAFMMVYKHGKKSGNLAEKEQRRIIVETSDTIKKFVTHRQQESELQKDVFGNAEQKKSELSGGTTGIDRFNLINDNLRQRSRTRDTDPDAS
jgi:hypothetical protein